MTGIEELIGNRVFLGTPVPSLSLLGGSGGGSSGLSGLSQSLTINSQTVDPTFIYRGEDASLNTWTAIVGEDISISGAGADPNIGQDTPFLDTTNKSVKFNGANYFVSGNTSYTEIDLEDIVIEFVAQIDDGSVPVIAAKRDGAGNGWRIDTRTSQATFLLDDTAAFIIQSAALVTDAWYHGMCFVDRSGLATWYINGTQSGTPLNVAAAGTLSGGGAAMSMGADATGATPFSKQIAYCAMWKKDSWLDTHLQASVALERFQRLSGLWPERLGTKLANTLSRSSEAYLDKIDLSGTRSLFMVGENWIRKVSRRDSEGTSITGILIEEARENICLQSEDFSAVPWHQLDTNDSIDTDAYVSPDYTTTADGLDAAANTGIHGVSQQITLTADTHSFAVWIKAGVSKWAYIANQTVPGCDGYFDLENAAEGTIGGGAAFSFVEDWGNGWIRCSLEFAGTVASHTFVIAAANGDNDTSVTGVPGQNLIHMWGAQVEVQNSIDGTTTSYMKTAGASNARADDDLVYAASEIGNSQGSLVADVFLGKRNITSGAGRGVSFSDGTLNNRVELQLYTNATLRNIISNGGVLQSNIVNGTTDFSDGKIYTGSITWQTNSARMFVDGTEEGTEDTSVTPPSGMDELRVGAAAGGTSYGNVVISNIRVYTKASQRK